MSQTTRALRMPDEIYLKMKAIAKAEDRSTSKQIVRALDEYISTYEKEHGKIHLKD